MITHPERYIEAFVAAGANGVTVHAEACTHLQRTLAQIRDAGAKAGVAFNPATPPDVLDYVLDDLDLVLVMTVNPGFGGQAFLPATLPKIARVRDMIHGASQSIQIEVDGGITVDTVASVVSHGANALVAGTSVYGYPDGVATGVAALREAARKAV
jgi:ribulose-phosphate 3-epimerase